MNHKKTATKAAYFSIAGNTVLALIKGVAGIFGNSFALIADAIESTSDIFSSIIVLLGIKYSNKPADEDHPYGHGKAEALVTFVIVGFLIASAVVIARQSIVNIVTPHQSPKPYTLLVLFLIILWKEFSYRFVNKKSEQTNSTSLKADAWHHRSDAITSVAAFIGISVALILGKGYESADDWAALVASGIILYNSYRIFRPALGEVMDEHRYDELIVEIRNIAKAKTEIKNTEKCLVRKAGMRYYVDLHIIVDSELTVKVGHDIAHELKDMIILQLPQIRDVLIHVEPDE
jgi:cation diffusion facilitator family transporter